MCEKYDLIWWQNKIDTQKHFRKTTITSSWTLSETKILITIVEAQMPSNPNQKSHMQDNKPQHLCDVFFHGIEIESMTRNKTLCTWENIAF